MLRNKVGLNIFDWQPHIQKLRSGIHTLFIRLRSHWLDLLLALLLAIISGCTTYYRAQLIDPVYYECENESNWFHADLTIAYNKMTDRHGEQYNENVHPLFSLFTYPLVYAIRTVFDLDKVKALRMLFFLLAFSWTFILYILLRLIGCKKLDATIFSMLAMFSAAAMFWFVVPETFPFGSVSILLALGIVAIAQHTKLSHLWYIGVSALTLSFTVTNWMAGIIASIVNHTWRRSLQININAFCIVIVLWDMKKRVFPYWPKWEYFFWFNENRTESILTPGSGGLFHMIKSFFYHTIVMPAFELTDNFSVPVGEIVPDNWYVMVTQSSFPGSGGIWGAIAVVLWTILLGLGVWALLTIKNHRSFLIALGLMIIGQLALHTLYNDEVFCFSIHFAPLLIVLVALSSLTRFRVIALIVATLLLICLGINNSMLFVKAVDLMQCLP